MSTIGLVGPNIRVLRHIADAFENALKAISTSSGRSWVTQQRFPEHVLNRKFDYGFSLGLLLKDVETYMGMLQESDTPAPLLRATRELVQMANKAYGDEADHLEIAKMVENWSGEKIK